MLYIGQWQGYYQYGPEYGEIVQGQEAEFRLFIEEYVDGQFKGRAIDWEGFGASGEEAIVSGFYDNGLISMIKEYDKKHLIDEWGNSVESNDGEGYKVEYMGNFDEQTQSFSGTWEIISESHHTPETTWDLVATGTWRMHKANREA